MNTETPKKVMYDGTEYEIIGEEQTEYRLSKLGWVDKSRCTPITEVPKWVLYQGAKYEVVGTFNNGMDYVLNIDGNHIPTYAGNCTPCDAPNNELPKVGEWWECVKDVNYDRHVRFIKGKKYKSDCDYCLTSEIDADFLISGECDYRSHFIKSTPPTERTPSAYKTKSGQVIPIELLTPIYTTPFTLEDGTKINLTDNDIKKLKELC